METDKAYTGFASVYDLFMDNVPYGDWAESIAAILKEWGIADGLVLDLGCGTGKLTGLLADAGYDMIGVDSSEDMLAVACEAGRARRREILYLCQDMRAFELYGTVRAVVSVCDTMNYLTSYEDLVQVFKLVNNYLDPGGIFLFDLNTVYKYRQELGGRTIAENRDEGSFIWENWFDGETGINEYDLTFYVRCADGRYERYEETHRQRAWETAEVIRAAEEAGMKVEKVCAAFSGETPRETTDRICFIVREQGKENGF